MRIYNNQILDVDASDVVNGTVLIPQNIRSIGRRAFMNLSDLKYITIPENVKFIGAEAFINCVNLRVCQFVNENCLLGTGIFRGRKSTRLNSSH